MFPKKSHEDSRASEAYKATFIGFVVNLLLTLAKFVAGILGHSGAMFADAIHSLSDFVTDLVVIFFIKLSSKPHDDSHSYGHGKFETLATVIIGSTLFIVGTTLLKENITLIIEVLHGKTLPRPRIVALVAAGISILSKEILFQYTAIIGKKIESPAVIANAWHHRSDALSSIGTLVGIAGAIFLGDKWHILDPIAAIIVSLLIARVAFQLMIPALNDLLEKALPKDVEQTILSIIKSVENIDDPHNLKTRRIGANCAIEFHVRVNPNMSVQNSHDIATKLENLLRKEFGTKTHIIIHIEPKLITETIKEL